jgi:hypothetical protein
MRITFLRNELVLWASAKRSLTLQQLSSYIIELDNLLQALDL